MTHIKDLNNMKNDITQTSLFEEDYLIRTLGTIAHSNEIALTELVANAWDAGATQVHVTIPENRGEKLIVEDNGTGITSVDFQNRWMKLGYNRLKHQGKNVLFPPNVKGKRIAYGRNGIGRHGLLCFNNEYNVTTFKGNEKSVFNISTSSAEQPFVIKSFEITTQPFEKFGTRLEVIVDRNLPTENRMLEIISARFLHDPSFRVFINGKTVELEEHTGLIDSREILINDKIKINVHFIDTKKSSRSTIYQGIAFWQSNRLVGEPTWILGSDFVIDGRTRIAKRYTIVVTSDDLADYILEDWTGFKKDSDLNIMYSEIEKYFNEIVYKISKETIEETMSQVTDEFSSEISSLSPMAKYELNLAIQDIAISNPTAKAESISLAVNTVIKLEKSRSGKDLLSKLINLSDDDINGLNHLLENWSVRDALSVLNEIDNRISVVEAIRKLSSDEDVDELHVLHPLVTSARWLFGPEFESAEFASNRQLQNAIKIVFKKDISTEQFTNSKKRPDLVIFNNSTASISGTELHDSETGLVSINKVLLIELKRGKFKITRNERNQAQGYVEDIVGCGALIGNPFVEAFVVGDSFGEKISPVVVVKNDNNVEIGKIRVTTFAQLVDTAEKRLFGLREKLAERYDDVDGMYLFQKQSLNQSKLEL